MTTRDFAAPRSPAPRLCYARRVTPLRDELRLLDLVRGVHEQIRAEVVAGCERAAAGEMAAVAGREGGDTIYAVDRLAERVLVERFTVLAEEWPCLLIAEGLGASGRVVLPKGTPEEKVEIVVIVDPIDGTRGLMFQKRPAWILTGVAPHRRGTVPTLGDIRLAVQTEIPLVKQHLSDTAWAIAGQGAAAERFDRLTGARQPIKLRPSTAEVITHGFGSLAKFFSGTRAELASIDDAVVDRIWARAPAPAKRWCSTTSTSRPAVSSSSSCAATIAGWRTCDRC